MHVHSELAILKISIQFPQQGDDENAFRNLNAEIDIALE